MHVKPSEISSNDEIKSILTESLAVFLKQLFCHRKFNKNLEIKTSSIGQALMQCIRPKACVCPLQIALGVSVHNLCGSELLVTILNKVGFSCSIDEVRKFKEMHLF